MSNDLKRLFKEDPISQHMLDPHLMNHTVLHFHLYLRIIRMQNDGSQLEFVERDEVQYLCGV